MNIICPDHNLTKRIEGGVEINSPCFHFTKGCCLLPTHYRCIEYIRRKNPTLRRSHLALFDKCRRAFYHADIQGYTSAIPGLPPTLGNLLHARKAILHADGSTPEIKIEEQKKLTQKYVDTINTHYRDPEYTIAPIILMTKGLIKGYEQWSAGEPKGTIEMPVGLQREGFSIRTTLDLILNFDTDEEEIIDYKYTKNPDYYTKFHVEHQSGIYLLTRPKAKKITFRLVRVPQLKKGSNESNAEFVERMTKDFLRRKNWYITNRTFYRHEFDFDRIEKEVGMITNEIKKSIDYGIEGFRQDYSRGACYHPWPCEFLPCCESGLLPENLPNKYIKREIE